MMLLVKFYARRQAIGWLWQAIDSKSCPAPLGGSQIHLLVDERGAPLAVCVTGANVHDTWLADDLIISIVVPRPDPEAVEQHVCMDKGYDYPHVHQFVELARYVVDIKHRRRRGEPVVEDCPIPGETQFPARRWVVERRSLRTRWCKKADNWLVPIFFSIRVFSIQ